MRRPLIVALTLNSLLLPSFGTTAVAQGAQVDGGTANYYGCEESGSTTSCWDVIVQSRFISTPSGTGRSMVNFPRACLTQTDTATGEIVYHQCYVFQEFFMAGENGMYMEHARDIVVATQDGVTYCYGFLFQEANGVNQVNITYRGTGEECRGHVPADPAR
jgi:hypothetical protein